MIGKLLFRRGRPAPRLPPGQRVYAVGDIHGRLDLLDGLLARIAADEQARGGPPATLVFLGDLVDRGPDSASVVERLRTLVEARPGTRFLLGNHEEVLLRAIAGEVQALRLFARIGGEQTALSYGIAAEAYRAADFPELGRLLAAAVPPAHRAFLEMFEDHVSLGDYLFVHAGVRPGVPLADQRPEDLRWIRDPFLSSARPLADVVVVHGHTVTDSPVDLSWRVGVDTGACHTGTLTAVGLEAASRWFLAVTVGSS